MSYELRISQLRVVSKRSGQRVVVELDDGKALEIDPEIAVRRGLKPGVPISDELVERLRCEDESLRARRRLTRYLTLRVKSVADARLYLEKARFSQAAIGAAIEAAIERDLLDDRRFAERYVRTKIKTSPIGPLRLLADLLAHGIAPSLAEEVLAPQFDPKWQRETAELLASKRRKRKRASDDKAERKRFGDWLRQRGFEDEVAREVAERATRKT